MKRVKLRCIYRDMIMKIISFIIAAISVAFLCSIFTYKQLALVSPLMIHSYNTHLGGKYAENTIRNKKLNEILAKLKPLVDDNSKAELEAIFCFLKYKVLSETPPYNGPRDILFENSTNFSTDEKYKPILPILKKNIQQIKQERQIFNAPFTQTYDDLPNIIPFLKRNLRDYVIEVYKKRAEGKVVGMVFCYPKELIKRGIK